MRYFKRHWAECRGDIYGDWGTSDWYFEIDTDLCPTRQMEVYANGNVLKYDSQHLEDLFGGLSSGVAFDVVDFAPFEISHDEFDQAWKSHQANNR